MREINRLIIHNSLTPGGDVEFMRDIHLKKGWSDVGYHYIICNGKPHGNWPAGMDGLIQDGIPVEIQGAHAKGANKDSIGICLIGNFKEDLPTSNQIISLTSLCIELCRKYKIQPIGGILGHRDVNNTLCPGRYLYQLISPMRIFLEGVILYAN